MEEGNTSVDTDSGQGNTGEGSPGGQGQGTESAAQSAPPPVYVPFSGGKEKFKVNGEELEWDWETTKRYAQVGKAGYEALQRAAAVEKKAKEAYQKMVQAAQSDPDGLISILNPAYKKSSQATRPEQSQQDQSQEVDPRDLEIQRIRQEFEPLKAKLEAQEIAEERKAYETERESVLKTYPNLSTTANKAYLESVYLRYLRSSPEDMMPSLEDVAFAVNQELESERIKENKAKEAEVKKAKARAPVSTSPAGEAGTKPMSLEDVKRLAGRIV